VDSDTERFNVTTLHEWKVNAEREALAALGRADQGDAKRRRAAEDEIKRNLKLRRRLRRVLLKPRTELRDLPVFHRPYEKFAHSEVIIRSITDTTYPEVDDSPGPGISGWFKVELYDFYHNGLVVILGLDRGVIDTRGHWKVIRHDATYDESRFREIKVWHLGRVPWRNIRECDPDGDEYHNFPQLYCDFADNGMPYEDFVYAMLDEDYDWPLGQEKCLGEQDDEVA